LLIHASGARLAADCIEADMDVGDLCRTLMDAQRMIAGVMNQALDSDIPIQQSYYGTESYNICTYRLDDGLFVATIFGPEVREGQVWYAMREAATELKESLAARGPSVPARRSAVSDSWRDDIEQYFTDASAERAHRRRSPRDNDKRAVATLSTEQPVTEPHTENRPEGAQIPPDPTRPSGDQNHWAIPDNQDGDQVVTEQSGTFEGIGFEEAQSRGLYTLDPNTKRPSLDDIDWEAATNDAATDLDWNSIVAEADQGFGGMSLEEARKRGIIDDLERE
jgi:hypothetical protein